MQTAINKPRKSSLVIRKRGAKPQGETTSHHLEGLKTGTPTTSRTGEEAGQLEYAYCWGK